MNVFLGEYKGVGPITNKPYYFRDEHMVFPRGGVQDHKRRLLKYIKLETERSYMGLDWGRIEKSISLTVQDSVAIIRYTCC